MLFAGGGTGGHLMPALAIAEAMVALDPSVRPWFVGGERGVEAGVLPQRPWPFALLPLEPIYRRAWWKNLGLPLSLYRSFRGVREILRAEQPVLVVGTGGYVSGPAVWAAVNRNIPAIIQEQNAYPGFATRKLARRVRQVHLGFPEARRHLGLRAGADSPEVFDSGNPIVALPRPRPERADAKARLGFDPARPLVLTFGGSQGSLALNQVVSAALSSGRWPEGVQLLWQTGEGSFAEFRNLDRAGVVQVRAFIDPMAAAYAAADLAVARSGAMTIAELCAWGIPAVLVPLPTAAAGHQLINAAAQRDAGAAVLLEQSLLTPDTLGARVRTLLGRPDEMARMAAAAGNRARPEAANEIARQALRLV